jgi:S-adenosylmethionine hydrolase
MADPIITLTTDFGPRAPYVAALKGVVLSVSPAARLVDLTHQVPPQDLRHAAFFLATAVPWFPPGTIHVIVVDPGVGTERALLYVAIGEQQLLVPDNGCWTMLAQQQDCPPRVIRLEQKRFWRETVSATFHGRDILAPVAGHLSRGVLPRELGPEVQEWVRLDIPIARAHHGRALGEVIFIDDFGNLLSNISAEGLPPPDLLHVGKRHFRHCFHWVRTYGEAQPGRIVVLPSSGGLVEVAVVGGSAVRQLKAEVGTPVLLGWTRCATLGEPRP